MKLFALVKKKIIEILFVAAVVLLAANLLIAKYLMEPVRYKRNLQTISPVQINQIFFDDLDAFALHRDWIKKFDPVKGDNSALTYSVDIPKDLPIPVVLKEIYESFYDKNVRLRTVEKILGGKTQLSIYLDNNLKLKAIFNYNEKLKREGKNIGLLIEGMDELNAGKLDYLVKFPQAYAALLVPSKASARLADTLTNYRKEYAVLLNDDINDMDYKLRGGFSPLRIKSALRTTMGAYPKALFYVIDDKSKLYNSTAFYLIKQQLQNRNILLLKLRVFKSVSGSGNSVLRSDFKMLLLNKSVKSTEFILVPADDFNVLQPQIFSYIKIGYKFVNPSLILASLNGKKN